MINVIFSAMVRLYFNVSFPPHLGQTLAFFGAGASHLTQYLIVTPQA